jgi:hypothetical protein
MAVRDFDMKDAKTWFPISALLVSVIYTGSKSLVSTRSSVLAWECNVGFGATGLTSTGLAPVSSAIPFDSRVHHLQELDDHSHRAFCLSERRPWEWRKAYLNKRSFVCLLVSRLTERSSGSVVTLPVLRSARSLSW